MKMKYCPECGSIQLQCYDNRLKCKKCSYNGLMKEDSIDVINSFVTAKKRQPADSNSTYVFIPKSVSQSIPQKPIQVQTPNSNSVETRSSFNSSVLMQQENKPESLKERMKKFQSEHVEIF